MRILMILFTFSFTTLKLIGQVSIGAPTAHPSAQLDVSSSTKGFLPPRMTITERNAISNPSPGLMIFNTTTQSLEIFSLNGGWYGIQTQVVERKLLGSSRTETVNSILQTTDGGFIVAGTSTNLYPNGDIIDSGRTGSANNINYWIAKLDADRNIKWNKIFGGRNDEIAYSVLETSDGGYIVSGSSSSSNTGDVGTNHSALIEDFWILKLTNNGSIKWMKMLGGTGSDVPFDMQQTKDGGYIIAGSSYSSQNGDVTGTGHGFADYWIVKLDVEGNISWQRLLGGSGNDIPASIQQTQDGGYIIAGVSTSSATGDVTASNHGGTGSPNDYWIVKLTIEGNIAWQNLLGGSGNDKATSVVETKDGSLIVAGYSGSSANGDVSGTNHGGRGGSDYDYWIIKLDSRGRPLWDKLIGGYTPVPDPSFMDYANSIIESTDGGYVIAGTSGSSAIGDVSYVNHGVRDYWIVKLSESGNISWNKLFGGRDNDEAIKIIQTADGNYVIAGYSDSSESGNVNALNHGSSDLWIIKIDISGNLF